MRVSVSARVVTTPRKCACCGAEPVRDVDAVAVRRTRGRKTFYFRSSAYGFPYCRKCLAHVVGWPKPWGAVDYTLIMMTAGIWALLRALADAIAKAVARSITVRGWRMIRSERS